MLSRTLLHAASTLEDSSADRSAPVSRTVGARRSLRVLIAGGGTGGHLFPGVALAEEVKARGGEVLFVGTERGIEARVLAGDGWRLACIDATGIKGRGLKGLVLGLLRLPLAWWQSLRILRGFRPDVVVGVGGYASGPLVATAAMLLYKTAILEQNSIPGITNRILARLVRRVFCTFPDRLRRFPARKVVLAGNPIRRKILSALQGAAASEAAGSRAPRLFVFGGSQGARAINDRTVAAAAELAQRVPGLEILHQTGKADEARVREGYAALGLTEPRVRVAAFLTDMATPYGWCDLVLCRAGATSLAELAAAGKPAVLVPFPQATDNHQEHNARALVDVGAAVLLRESEWTDALLAGTLVDLLGDPARLAAMRAAMLGAARPQAAADIADALTEMCGAG
ncbi:MAG: undecaprenyldiphospho-muramoylpentapeptide beta-N-acetylglucosaminyltransferase [Myxococcales bacterium]|nr:undecaprenyldiphospho-muramoylpentapeptide beta-N-acetylglucosaminyltransferase [Myxococcales bacterium]